MAAYRQQTIAVMGSGKMAKKYIDAERFVEYFGDWYTEEGTELGFVGPIKDLVFRMPAADIEPRWIPVTERLPEEPFGCLVTVWDTDPISMDEFENLLPYFVGWDGEQWNDSDGIQCPFEVLAWMPLPEPYKEGEQNG